MTKINLPSKIVDIYRREGPYVRWCERRTSSLIGGEAVYSIGGRFDSFQNYFFNPNTLFQSIYHFN